MSLPSVTRTRPADTLAMVRVLVFAGPVELKGIKSRLAPEAAPNLKVPGDRRSPRLVVCCARPPLQATLSRCEQVQASSSRPNHASGTSLCEPRTKHTQRKEA